MFGVSTSGAMGLSLRHMNDILSIGDTAHLGVKDGINFTLRSAEYTLSPEEVAGKLIVPKVTEKLVVLKVKLQYPDEGRLDLRASDVNVIARDLAGKNFEGLIQLYSQAGRPVSTVLLRPGQQADAVCVLLVPALSTMKQLDVFVLDRRVTATYSSDGIQPLPIAMRDSVAGSVNIPFTVRDAELGQAYCIGAATVAFKRSTPSRLTNLEASTGFEIEVANPNKIPIEIAVATFKVMVGKDRQQRECMLEWLGMNAPEAINLLPKRSITAKINIPAARSSNGEVINVVDSTTRRGLRMPIR